MIAVLTMPKFFNTILVGGALLGFVIALPVAWVASKKLSSPQVAGYWISRRDDGSPGSFKSSVNSCRSGAVGLMKQSSPSKSIQASSLSFCLRSRQERG